MTKTDAVTTTRIALFCGEIAVFCLYDVIGLNVKREGWLYLGVCLFYAYMAVCCVLIFVVQYKYWRQCQHENHCYILFEIHILWCMMIILPKLMFTNVWSSQVVSFFGLVGIVILRLIL